MCDVHRFASESYVTRLVVVAVELDASSGAVPDGTGLDASIKAAENICLEV
jgi:hypothetical protein